MSDVTMAEHPVSGEDYRPQDEVSESGVRPRRGPLKKVVSLGLLAVAVALPFYAPEFWLQIGTFVAAAIVGALGLNLLVGHAGQVSLAHPFFIAIGAYGYTYFAAESTTVGVRHQIGLSLPPVIAAAAAIVLAGLAGLAFTPVAARLKGIYLAVASFGLVFLGQHLLFNAEPLTGGFNGRDVPPFSIFGFTFAEVPGQRLNIFGIVFGRAEKLWYLGLICIVVAYLLFVNLRRTRVGRALQAVRDGEIPAAVMGVDIARYKAKVFVLSSMYAGLAGVLLALAFRRLVPNSYDITMAIDYLAMIVIGGMGSPAGSIAGAAFVSSLPSVLSRYSDVIPFLAKPGSDGVTAGIAARFAFGFGIVFLLLYEPGGIAALGTRARRRFARRREAAA